MRFLTLIIGFMLGAVVFIGTSLVIAWTGPTAPPPNGNIAAPLNTGTADQIKDGILGVNGLAVFGNAIVQGASRYLNFGTIPGSSGYGIRDNAGIMEFKDSGGVWTALIAGGAGSSTTSVQRNTFSTAGSYVWTKPANADMIFVECWGGGGAGGKHTSSNQTVTGGAGGAYISAWFLASELPDNVPITVGAAVSGRTTIGNGTDGNSSSFGSYLTASGGGGGRTGFEILSAPPAATGAASSIAFDVSLEPGGGSSIFFGDNAIKSGASGGGVSSSAGLPGGNSVLGGDGGAGASSSSNGGSGSAPGGGGGGQAGASGSSGSGAQGRCNVVTIIR